MREYKESNSYQPDTRRSIESHPYQPNTRRSIEEIYKLYPPYTRHKDPYTGGNPDIGETNEGSYTTNTSATQADGKISRRKFVGLAIAGVVAVAVGGKAAVGHQIKEYWMERESPNFDEINQNLSDESKELDAKIRETLSKESITPEEKEQVCNDLEDFILRIVKEKVMTATGYDGDIGNVKVMYNPYSNKSGDVKTSITLPGYVFENKLDMDLFQISSEIDSLIWTMEYININKKIGKLREYFKDAIRIANGNVTIEEHRVFKPKINFKENKKTQGTQERTEEPER